MLLLMFSSMFFVSDLNFFKSKFLLKKLRNIIFHNSKIKKSFFLPKPNFKPMTQFRQETPNGHITFHYKSSSNIEHPQISPKLLQNQNKSFFQFTTNCFPKSLKTFERAKLPFAVFFQPFASVLNVINININCFFSEILSSIFEIF